MPIELVLTDAPSVADREAVERGLIAYNSVQGIANDWRPLAVLMKEQERTVGGLVGWTMWRWMFVALFFLPARQRGQGLGKRMLRMAEDEARTRGCIGAWLDTHSWQARPFYEKLGYRAFGELADYPPGQARFFVQKRL